MDRRGEKQAEEVKAMQKERKQRTHMRKEGERERDSETERKRERASPAKSDWGSLSSHKGYRFLAPQQ